MVNWKNDIFAPQDQPWKLLKSPLQRHDNPYFSVQEYEAIAPTGVAATYWVTRRKSRSVAILPLYADGQVCLIGQWRFPLQAYSWEIPKGAVPDAESLLVGAQRELQEEANLVAKSWRHILTLEMSNASSDELCDIFLATDLQTEQGYPDPTEALSIMSLSFQDLLSAVQKGKIRDAVTVSAVLRLYQMIADGDLSKNTLQGYHD